MKFLFERLKELKQMGILQVVDLKAADSVKPRETAHDDHSDELNKKIEVNLSWKSHKFMSRL